MKRVAKAAGFDAGKLRWSLLPWRELEDVVIVLEYGAKKYSPNGWQKLDLQTYVEKVGRHSAAIMMGQYVDPESGLSHFAHLACDALFALYHYKRRSS